MQSPRAPLLNVVSIAWMFSMIGDSAVPVFLKYTVHSTVGKSWYWTPTQCTRRPLWGSLQVKVCCSRWSSSFCVSRSSFHWPRNSADACPPYRNENGGCVEYRSEERRG